MQKTLLFLSLLLTFSIAVNAQLVVIPNEVDEMVTDFFDGTCVSVSNVTYTGASGAIGFFDGSDFDIGVNAGILLSSGSIFNAIGPNDSGSSTTSWGTAGDSNLNALGGGTQDAAVLQMDIVSTEPTITFEYVFGSEEYNEWVGSSFNDVFAFFISGPGIEGTQNIALIPGSSTW